MNDDSTLRKAGASTDPYEAFRRMLQHDRIGADFEAPYRDWLEANLDLQEATATEEGPPSDGEELPDRSRVYIQRRH
jgi:hypothetical protein